LPSHTTIRKGHYFRKHRLQFCQRKLMGDWAQSRALSACGMFTNQTPKTAV